jgi:hypothetical protein
MVCGQAMPTYRSSTCSEEHEFEPFDRHFPTNNLGLSAARARLLAGGVRPSVVPARDLRRLNRLHGPCVCDFSE